MLVANWIKTQWHENKKEYDEFHHFGEKKKKSTRIKGLEESRKHGNTRKKKTRSYIIGTFDGIARGGG